MKNKEREIIEVYRRQLKNMPLNQLKEEWDRVMLQISSNSYQNFLDKEKDRHNSILFVSR